MVEIRRDIVRTGGLHTRQRPSLMHRPLGFRGPGWIYTLSRTILMGFTPPRHDESLRKPTVPR